MSEEIHYDDWMSDADALMWHIERDPQLRSTVTSVWVLDQPPDLVRFREMVAGAVREVPRLRQVARPDPLGAAPPRWEDAPSFDLDYHLRRSALPAGGGPRELLDLAAPIAEQAFDRDRPLWELHLVDGDDRAAMILKLHHSVSDGVGLVRMTEGLVQQSRESEPDRSRGNVPFEAPEAPTRELARTGEALKHRLETAAENASAIAGSLARGASALLRDPVAAAREGVESLQSLGRVLQPVDRPLSPVMTGRSMNVRFDVFTLGLDDLRQAAGAVDGTVNDAFLTIVGGALRRYHEAMGSPVEALRVSMPINVRRREQARRAGNQFFPARFAVPVGIEDPLERMQAIHDLVRRTRAEPGLAWVGPINTAISRLGVRASTRVVGSMMKALDFAASNVPGPRRPAYSAGAKVQYMFPFGPLAGAAVNVSLVSYAGVCQLGINSDPAAVRDPALLMKQLEHEAEAVLALGRR